MLSTNVVAISDNSLALDDALDVNSMTWPMLPGENLNDLARLFYPINQAMQRQFVAKTLSLSANIQDNLKPEKRFEEPTLLVIPTLKSLSNTKNTGRKKPHKQKLKLSYDIGQAVEQVPAKLLQDYEWLMNKNAFLKKELAKLNEKIVLLQAKLNDLKLILDKTLNFPNPSVPNESLPNSSQLTSDLSTNNLPAKKVFKNLSDTKHEIKKSDPVEVNTTQTSTAMPQAVSSLFGQINKNLIIILFAALALLALSTFLLKKYRQRLFSRFTEAIPKMDDTLLDFGGHWKDTEQSIDQHALQEMEQVIQNTEAKTLQPNTVQPKATQPNTIQTSAADTTLVEAKLLMSVNRSHDAIAHLELTIQANPKVSINHWLYLLEIFRKLNLKEEFEKYAAGLKTNFNVNTQAWDDSIAPSTLPQHLEEFPNIMEKLYTVWPTDEAKDYLRSLITDSRDGDRAGFGKAVLSEILFLIALLGTRKDFN
jgi:hypothetical protein